MKGAIKYVFLKIMLITWAGQISGQSLDSLEFYDRANDYTNLNAAVSKEAQLDPRLGYYLARSYNMESVDTALRKIDSLLDLPIYSESSKWKERVLAHQISLERKKGNYNSVLTEALALLPNLTDPVSIFDVSHNVSISYRRLNQYDSSMKWGLSIMAQSEAIQDVHREHRAVQNMANLHSALRNFDKALTLEKALIPFADEMNNGDLRVLDRCNLGSSFLNLTLYDSAKHYLNEALDLATSLAIEKRIPLILYNLSSLNYNQNQFEAALELLNHTIESAQRNEQPTILVRSRYLLALCYLEQSNIESVQSQIDLGIADARRYKLRQDQVYFLELLADVYSRNGNYKESISTLQTLRQLEDSVLNDERIRTIEELQTKYETEKKEQQIQVLEQEKLIADFRIRQQNALMLGGGALVIVLGLIGYVFYRNRTLRLAQARLTTEQQLFRSQMNPHFLFNALGAIHSYIFKGEKREAADYLSTFAELTRDILDQSAHEWITLEKEVATLTKYIDIQNVRFPDVSATINIESGLDLESLLLPPMLLQPFVENAFEHGLKNRKDGKLQVHINFEKENLKLTVEDNGVGLKPTSKGHESKSTSITQKRLQLLFGSKNFELNISNRLEGMGVLVSIAIPKKEVL